MSATGFEGERLFISYQIQTPDGWKLRTGNLVDGIADADIINIENERDRKGTKQRGRRTFADGIAGALLVDGYADGADAEGTYVYVHIVSYSFAHR